MTQWAITKTGEDYYHVFANDDVTHIEEDIDELKLMGMTGLTTKELLTHFDSEPIGHKITIPRK